MTDSELGHETMLSLLTKTIGIERELDYPQNAISLSGYHNQQALAQKHSRYRDSAIAIQYLEQRDLMQAALGGT